MFGKSAFVLMLVFGTPAPGGYAWTFQDATSIYGFSSDKSCQAAATKAKEEKKYVVDAICIKTDE